MPQKVKTTPYIFLERNCDLLLLKYVPYMCFVEMVCFVICIDASQGAVRMHGCGACCSLFSIPANTVGVLFFHLLIASVIVTRHSWKSEVNFTFTYCRYLIVMQYVLVQRSASTSKFICSSIYGFAEGAHCVVKDGVQGRQVSYILDILMQNFLHTADCVIVYIYKYTQVVFLGKKKKPRSSLRPFEIYIYLLIKSCHIISLLNVHIYCLVWSLVFHIV